MRLLDWYALPTQRIRVRDKYLLTKRQTFKGRTHPHVEMIQYLIHMNDRRKRAELDVKHNKKQLDKTVNDIASFVNPQNREESTRALCGRIAYLENFATDLTDLGMAIETLQKEVSEEIPTNYLPTTSYPSTHCLLVDRVSQKPTYTQLLVSDVTCCCICTSSLRHGELFFAFHPP